jgi:hypothetical protein
MKLDMLAQKVKYIKMLCRYTSHRVTAINKHICEEVTSEQKVPFHLRVKVCGTHSMDADNQTEIKVSHVASSTCRATNILSMRDTSVLP